MEAGTETWHHLIPYIKTGGYGVRALDLFCGGGLSSAGARDAGAELVAAVDLCPIATQTYAANFPGAIVVNRRLEEMSPTKLRDQVGDVDVILASPECTNHSCAKGSSPRSEESRETAMQLLRFARAFEPRWIVLENVVHMRPWSRYSELILKIRKLGYHVSEQVLDASHFGVAQRRRRLFVVCDREQEPAQIKPRADLPQRTVRDILDSPNTWDTTPLFKKTRAKDTLQRARRAIAELGENESFLVVYYGTDAAGGWQSLDRPLRTITTIDRFALVEPSSSGYQMRMLQVPELRRAMGLKANYLLPVGTRRNRIRLLGNGVCLPVMRSVVASFAKANRQLAGAVA